MCKLSSHCLEEIALAVVGYGIENGLKDYCALRVLGGKSKKAGLTPEEDARHVTEFRKMLVTHYVIAETLIYIFNENISSEYEFKKDVARQIEDCAFQFHMSPPPSGKAPAIDVALDRRTRASWSQVIGFLARAGRLEHIFSIFMETATKANQPKDSFTQMGLLNAVRYMGFSMAGPAEFKLTTTSVEAIIANFKILMGKNSKQRETLSLVFASWLSPILWGNVVSTASTFDSSLSGFTDRAIKLYKKHKALDAAVLTVVLICLRIRISTGSQAEKLKPLLSTYVAVLIGAIKQPATRCLALEGLFRVAVLATKVTGMAKEEYGFV